MAGRDAVLRMAGGGPGRPPAVRRRRLPRVPRRRPGQQARAADGHQRARGLPGPQAGPAERGRAGRAARRARARAHRGVRRVGPRPTAARLPPSWDLPHHRYRGTEVTVGAMAGAACAEWHLHAWDLARSLGKDYRPADPELVLAAWRAGMPQLWPAPAGDPGPGRGRSLAFPADRVGPGSGLAAGVRWSAADRSTAAVLHYQPPARWTGGSATCTGGRARPRSRARRQGKVLVRDL